MNIPFQGYKELASASGSLVEGVRVAFDTPIVTGEIAYYLRDKALWLKLNLSSPLFMMSQDFMVVVLCKQLLTLWYS